MTLTVWNHLIYLGISVALTIWVARTLHRNGRIFLMDCFHGNAGLADSVNHLLVVGFYLVNVGFVTLALKYGVMADTLEHTVETLSTKVGVVLLVLGFMHFFNLAVFNTMRRAGLAARHAPPPATPAPPALPKLTPVR
jgi:hypothetical protein